MRPGLPVRLAIVATCIAIPAAAQVPGGPSPGGDIGGPGFHGGPPPPRGPGSDNRAGLELGPPGRWWDDRQFAASIKLRPEQQDRMDAIFEQNRSTLFARLEAVQKAEARMHELTRSSAPDEPALFAQIDRIAQARADLEKANTHLLLLIRKEMDAGQIRQLEQLTQRER